MSLLDTVRAMDETQRWAEKMAELDGCDLATIFERKADKDVPKETIRLAADVGHISDETRDEALNILENWSDETEENRVAVLRLKMVLDGYAKSL